MVGSDDKDEEYNDEVQFDADNLRKFTFTQDAVFCYIQEQAGIPDCWILLDRQLIEIVPNKKLLLFSPHYFYSPPIRSCAS